MTTPPKDLLKALASPKVQAKWDALTPIGQSDFISWITSAKQEETRARRIEKARSMLLSGKRRPCCYALVPMNLYKTLGTTPKAKTTWSALTPVERRAYVKWVGQGNEAERIKKAISMLSKGTRHP